MKYILCTTDNCNVCDRAKSLIQRQKLNIEVRKATMEEIKGFRAKKILSFPVLKDDNGEIISFGLQAGYYIAENIETFKS